MEKYHVAKPTSQQLLWHEQEFGVIIHYLMDIYEPSFAGYKTEAVRTVLAPEKINPAKLDPEQWVRSAWEMGANYAVLVANHCTGFSLWPTKVNDYCTRSLKWKDGQGDIVGDFIKACEKYGLKPGLYYSTGCNGYYNINDEWKHDYQAPYYREYVANVEEQVKELWTWYGPLFEIWFDGGILPVEKGGPNLEPMLCRYQPDALCFQGPKTFPHDLRWVGNEDGLAPVNCWATTNDGDARFDGTAPNEPAGVGDPDGIYYWPAETDTPNRSKAAFGGGWGWKAGEEAMVRTPEELLDCYIRSVGRNSNLLLGMAIDRDGQFQDEEQFIAFGKLLKETFGSPLAEKACETAEETAFTLTLSGEGVGKYLVIRENIENGQRIRGFAVSVNGEKVYESQCIGHKRIVPLAIPAGAEVTVEITEAVKGWQLRDIAVC